MMNELAADQLKFHHGEHEERVRANIALTEAAEKLKKPKHRAIYTINQKVRTPKRSSPKQRCIEKASRERQSREQLVIKTNFSLQNSLNSLEESKQAALRNCAAQRHAAALHECHEQAQR